jgi:hypothetical protein
MVIWNILPRFGTLHQEKSDNPGVRGKKNFLMWNAMKLAKFFFGGGAMPLFLNKTHKQCI